IERQGVQSTIELPHDLLSQLIDSKDRSFIDLRMPFLISEVPDSSFNKNSGIKKGDVIIGLNNINTKYTDQLIPALKTLKGQQVEAHIKRDNTQLTIPLTINDEGKLGLIYATGASPKILEALNYYHFKNKKYSFLEAIPVGLN